jgi:hypothetical protein
MYIIYTYNIHTYMFHYINDKKNDKIQTLECLQITNNSCDELLKIKKDIINSMDEFIENINFDDIYKKFNSKSNINESDCISYISTIYNDQRMIIINNLKNSYTINKKIYKIFIKYIDDVYQKQFYDKIYVFYKKNVIQNNKIITDILINNNNKIQIADDIIKCCIELNKFYDIILRSKIYGISDLSICNLNTQNIKYDLFNYENVNEINKELTKITLLNETNNIIKFIINQFTKILHLQYETTPLLCKIILFLFYKILNINTMTCILLNTISFNKFNFIINKCFIYFMNNKIDNISKIIHNTYVNIFNINNKLNVIINKFHKLDKNKYNIMHIKNEFNMMIANMTYDDLVTKYDDENDYVILELEYEK